MRLCENLRAIRTDNRTLLKSMTYQKQTLLLFVLLIALLAVGCNDSSSSTVITSTPSSAPSRAGRPTVAKAPPIPKVQPGEEIVVIETESFGKVKIQLFSDVAPKHVENFKKLINEGFYNGLAFHRAVPNLIVQGGDPTTKGDDRALWGMGDEKLTKVNAEFNDRPFVKGTLGAARAPDPNSASSQFFICVSDYDDWTGQYTNFGQVIEGLSNVQVMTMDKTDAEQKLLNKIVMKKVYLEKYAGK
jgi:cyclophilin family peptidyl-prolyl cis-trans isomerase